MNVGPSDDAHQPAVRRQKTTGFRDKPEASAHAAPGSPARCETAKRLTDAQSPHLSSPPPALAAMLPRSRSSFSSSQTRNPPAYFQFHACWLHRSWFHGIGRLGVPSMLVSWVQADLAVDP